MRLGRTVRPAVFVAQSAVNAGLLGDGVTEMRVLAHLRLGDAVDRVAHRVVLRDELERAVASLLQQVGGTVGYVDTRPAQPLVDAGGVAVEVELLSAANHRLDDGVIGLRSDAEVTSVEPAADVAARDVLTGSEPGVGGRPLSIKVDVLVTDRGLSGVVAMRVAVPDAVCIVDAHVVGRWRRCSRAIALAGQRGKVPVLLSAMKLLRRWPAGRIFRLKQALLASGAGNRPGSSTLTSTPVARAVVATT